MKLWFYYCNLLGAWYQPTLESEYLNVDMDK